MIDQPSIETDRLILRPYRASDVQDIFEYASDPEVARFVSWDVHKTIDDSKKFLKWVEGVSSLCLPENTGSKRVMEKIGMVYEGLRRKAFVIRGAPVDIAHYALVR